MRTLILLSTLLLTACGHGDDSSSDSSTSASYKYQLVENGCDSGEHTADSLSKECTMLKDDGLNKGCAYTLRKQKYESDGCGTWGS